MEKEELELKLQAAPSLEQKAMEGEERVKATEDKFQKLKTMYTQIRDEHVKLLRQVRVDDDLINSILYLNIQFNFSTVKYLSNWQRPLN